MNRRVTLPEFVDLLDIHGHEMDRWPEAERNAGQLLLAESAEARQALDQARQLAMMLSGVHAPEPSAHLRARVLEVPIRHPRETGTSWWPFKTLTRPLLGLAAAAVLGIASGALVPPVADELPSTDWDEMSNLALGAHLDLEQW